MITYPLLEAVKLVDKCITPKYKFWGVLIKSNKTLAVNADDIFTVNKKYSEIKRIYKYLWQAISNPCNMNL